MKAVMVKKYETYDGLQFDSADEANRHEADVLCRTDGPHEARVSRATARAFALYMMAVGPTGSHEKSKQHFGKCEIEDLLDFIYGYKRDGGPADIQHLLRRVPHGLDL